MATQLADGGLATPKEIIDAARSGRMYILVDDEDGENEGDLIIPAQFATPDAINFMAMHGRGLICLAMSAERINELGLPPMKADNRSRHETAFTVSIEARRGVTTGISAADRARTIQTAIDNSKGADDIVSPGHVFPLVARNGGVLIRAGHTEAAVDISRLAGLNPSGVICEIMNADGEMARLPELIPFAQKHGLKIGTIKDLIAYRMQNDTIVELIMDEPFESEYGGDWRIRVYRNTTEGTEHMALVKGTIRPDEPALVRVHLVNLLEDQFGLANGRAHQLNASMLQIARHGVGAVVIPRELDGTTVRRYIAHEKHPVPQDGRFRTFGLGCLILNALGVRKMILLRSPDAPPITGIEGFGLEVLEQRQIADFNFELTLRAPSAHEVS